MDFQAISWEDIEEEYKEDKKLNALRQATMNNDQDQIKELLEGHKIKTKDTGGMLGIEPENLSLHKNVLLVNERIWVPKT